MLTIRYLGHSAFSLDNGEHEVLIDPFLSGNPTAVTSHEEHTPIAILLTHGHNDHVGDAVAIAKREDAPIITTYELANYLETEGAKTIGGGHGGTIKFQGGSAKFVPAWHSSSYTNAQGNVVAPGVPAGFVVRFGGKTVYFAGDTCLFGDMKLIGEEGLDGAVLPIGDHFTMGPQDALKAVKMLEPKVAFPCHYNPFEAIQQDEKAWGKKVESETDTKVVVLAPGESYKLTE